MTVTSISGGGFSYQSKEPSPILVEFLEKALERARMGEIIGMSCASLWFDHSASWDNVGLVGSFSMIGASCVARDDLMTICK